MMCCVMTRYHIMGGIDLHASLEPPFPAMPHCVSAMTQFGPWLYCQSKRSTTVDTAAGAPMTKVFDIGPLIPHVGLNALPILGLLLLMSSSQAHFGVSSVHIENPSGSGPVAVALFTIVSPQLNCGDILFAALPMPTGRILAPNTVVAGLTIGDFVAGFLSGIAAMGVTFLIGKLGGVVLSGLNNNIKLGHIAIRMFGPQWIQKFADKAVAFLGGTFPQKYLEMLVGFSIGSPSGYAFENAPLGSIASPFEGLAEAIGGKIDEWAGASGLNDYFNDMALIPTFPGLPPLPVPASAVEAGLPLLQGPLDVAKEIADGVASYVDPWTEWLSKKIPAVPSPLGVKSFLPPSP